MMKVIKFFKYLPDPELDFCLETWRCDRGLWAYAPTASLKGWYRCLPPLRWPIRVSLATIRHPTRSLRAEYRHNGKKGRDSAGRRLCLGHNQKEPCVQRYKKNIESNTIHWGRVITLDKKLQTWRRAIASVRSAWGYRSSSAAWVRGLWLRTGCTLPVDIERRVWQCYQLPKT